MNLYLPIEIFNREFHSKLLIAMESASKGMKVYMGRVKEYLLRDFFVPGIILQKSITPSPNRLRELKFFKKNNFIVTSLDEEDGLINVNKKYLIERYSNASIDLTNKIFTWGKFDYDNLSNKFPNHKKKFIKSGNPRLDFWRKDFEFYYKKKKLKYKDYIFFSLNFALTSKKELNQMWNFMKESGYDKRGITLSRLKKIRKDGYKMSEKFFELIRSLSKKTNLNIIVRPHPIDKLSNYDKLKRFKNVKIIKDGSISEWIYYAKVVVHSSCTGGLESAVRGRPTISYMPFRSIHGHKFASNYSKKIKNFNECLNLIEKITTNKKVKTANSEKFKLRAYNYLSKKPAYKIIAEELFKLVKKNNVEYQNNDFFLNFRFKARDIRSKLLKLNYGNIKFSFFDKSETLKIFEILKDLDPKFRNLRLNFIKKDIIQIKRSG